MAEDRELVARRHLALTRASNYYAEVHDPKSADTLQKLVALQDRVGSGGLTPQDFAEVVGVLHAEVDQLVVCRAVAILKGQHRRGNLTSEQIATCQNEARRLFQYRDWVGRAYGFNLAGELGDLSAIPGLDENARTEGNPFAREAAVRALMKLRAIAK